MPHGTASSKSIKPRGQRGSHRFRCAGQQPTLSERLELPGRPPGRVAARVAQDSFDFAEVPAPIRSSEVCLSYSRVGCDPNDAWVDGRVALIGDAAHPTYPIGANGGSPALLGAEAIAACRAASPRELSAAFAAFQVRRHDAANSGVLSNRARGPEKPLQLADERIAAGEVPEGGPILPPKRSMRPSSATGAWLAWSARPLLRWPRGLGSGLPSSTSRAADSIAFLSETMTWVRFARFLVVAR
jgi:hypothetical protein